MDKSYIDYNELSVEYNAHLRFNREKRLYIELAKQLLIENSDKLVKEVKEVMYKNISQSRDGDDSNDSNCFIN